MGYAPRRQIQRDKGINWLGVTIVALIVFIGSIFLGRWIGEMLLSSRTPIQSPPTANYSPPPTMSPSPSQTENTIPNPPDTTVPRQNVTPPPLTIPPPATEPSSNTGQNSSSPSESSDVPKVTDEATSTPPKQEQKGAGFKVQAGMFTTRENAQDFISELSQKGFASNLETVSQDGKTLYRVYLGPYDNKDKANSTAKGLSEQGYPGFVVQEH